MDDFAYMLWQHGGKWVIRFFAVLLSIGVIYGVIINDIPKGLETMYWEPVKTFFGWVGQGILNEIQDVKEHFFKQ